MFNILLISCCGAAASGTLAVILGGYYKLVPALSNMLKPSFDAMG
jgi:uncharacterized membrane protein